MDTIEVVEQALEKKVSYQIISPNDPSFKRTLLDDVIISIDSVLNNSRGAGFRITIDDGDMEIIRQKMSYIKAVALHDSWVEGDFVNREKVSIPKPEIGEKWHVRIICKGLVVICLPISKC